MSRFDLFTFNPIEFYLIVEFDEKREYEVSLKEISYSYAGLRVKLEKAIKVSPKTWSLLKEAKEIYGESSVSGHIQYDMTLDEFIKKFIQEEKERKRKEEERRKKAFEEAKAFFEEFYRNHPLVSVEKKIVYTYSVGIGFDEYSGTLPSKDTLTVMVPEDKVEDKEFWKKIWDSFGGRPTDLYKNLEKYFLKSAQ